MNTLLCLQALSNDQLIEKIAVEVMGWHKGERPYWYLAFPEDIGTVTNYRYSEEGHKTMPLWDPLTNWSHTMEVVNKMRDQYFSKRLRYRKAWEQVTGINMSEALTHLDQRELCLAALLAVS